MKTKNMNTLLLFGVLAAVVYFFWRSSQSSASDAAYGDGLFTPSVQKTSSAPAAAPANAVPSPVDHAVVLTRVGDAKLPARDPNCALTMFFGSAWAKKYGC